MRGKFLRVKKDWKNIFIVTKSHSYANNSFSKDLNNTKNTDDPSNQLKFEEMLQYHKKQGVCYQQALKNLCPNTFCMTLNDFEGDNIDPKELENSLIITLGGDGTFLQASLKIPSNNTDIFGINTDPTNSVGFLQGHKLKVIQF